MKNVVLYFHGGSKNHGCEAIVRSTHAILKKADICAKLYTFSLKEDKLFALDTLLPITQTGPMITHKKGTTSSIKRILPKPIFLFIRKFKKLITSYKKNFNALLTSDSPVYLSIGGDNYCYGTNDLLFFLNKELSKQHKTVLWGCSVEPKELASNKTMRKDLSRYSLITARESLTYNALLENGISKNTHLFPDPAFALELKQTDLPDNFIIGNTVGINLSPLVQRLEQGNNLIYKNARNLIKHIIRKTNMNICLIAHVIWENNNDLTPLASLYEEFKHTGRVSLVGHTQNACELKYIISKCRFMVAARTHASIAAYSTQVPTLVIGYSVKSRGIAKDIFNKVEGYVLPVQNIENENELTNAFINIERNETAILAHYQKFMPNYIKQAYKGAEEVKKLIGAN